MKRPLFFIIALSIIVFLGYALYTTLHSSENQDSSVSMGEFSIESCNTYVKLVECVIEKGPAAGRDRSRKSLDEAKASWKNIPEESLTEACNQIMESVHPMKEIYAQMGCAF